MPGIELPFGKETLSRFLAFVKDCNDFENSTGSVTVRRTAKQQLCYANDPTQASSKIVANDRVDFPPLSQHYRSRIIKMAASFAGVADLRT